ALRLPALADDSGLQVDVLNGAPGVLSARYAGTGAGDDANIARLLREMDGVPEELRTARFVCVMALAHPDCETLFFRGETEGLILAERRGSGGFGYDPVFFSPELGGTFAEDTAGKARVSHRVRALEKLLAHLKSRPGLCRKSGGETANG
ncbi:MAG TPA: hypothetical protein ENN09_06810, partial [Planctomycetes bacterium]|nr:hypothetical protein [Planctomycetota bacterium]